jgi:hypothetical protein
MSDPDLRPHGYAPGDYVGRCGGCGAQFCAAKLSMRCRKCAEGLYQLAQENKQRAKENAEWLAWRDQNRTAADALIAGTAAVVPVEATEAMTLRAWCLMNRALLDGDERQMVALLRDVIEGGRLDRGAE